MRAGGVIKGDRINNALNMTRSIGDFSFKENSSNTIEHQIIIPIPDIKVYKTEENEEYLVLIASDGVWECFEEKNILA